MKRFSMKEFAGSLVSGRKSVSRRRRRRRGGLGRIECLENRVLLSADIGLDDGVLQIEGTEQADVIEISYETGDPDDIEVVIRDAFGNELESEDYDVEDVDRIVVNALGGNDTVINQTSIDEIVYAGDGNDTILGGRGASSVIGDVGNDVIYGREGHDYLSGGIGDDTVYGQAGDDTLVGSSGADFLSGSTGDDLLYGHSGDDILYGSWGDDALKGGSGNDQVYGQGDDDYLTGDHGNDTVDGGSGNDRIYGDMNSSRPIPTYSGHDELNGGSGNDTLYGGYRNDTLLGGSGLDALYGESGQDRLDGGDDGQRDYLSGGTGADLFIDYGRYQVLDLGNFWAYFWNGQETIADLQSGEDVVARYFSNYS